MNTAMQRLIDKIITAFEVGPTVENSYGTAPQPDPQHLDGESKAVEVMRRGFGVVGDPADVTH